MFGGVVPIVDAQVVGYRGVMFSTRHPYRDRHGRGMRSPLFFPRTPAWRTRRERFEEVMARVIEDFTRRWPAVATIEFACEDVPPSDPAAWEDHSCVLSRLFPADRRRALKDRIVVYRLPVVARAQGEELERMVRHILLERINRVLIIPPDEYDEALSQ